AGSRAFVFGGKPPQLWVLRLDSTGVWHRPSAAATMPTAPRMPIAWDAAGGRLLALDLEAVPTAGAWAVTPGPVATWSPLVTSNPGPPRRGGASVTFDARRRRLLVFGGAGEAFYGDLWQLRLDGVPTWDTLPPLFSRGDAKLVVDESRDLLVLFGGYTS